MDLSIGDIIVVAEDSYGDDELRASCDKTHRLAEVTDTADDVLKIQGYGTTNNNLKKASFRKVFILPDSQVYFGKRKPPRSSSPWIWTLDVEDDRTILATGIVLNKHGVLDASSHAKIKKLQGWKHHYYS